jgi:hypothetical protein
VKNGWTEGNIPTVITLAGIIVLFALVIMGGEEKKELLAQLEEQAAQQQEADPESYEYELIDRIVAGIQTANITVNYSETGTSAEIHIVYVRPIDNTFELQGIDWKGNR